jgi:hypothetical protein
MMALNPIAYTEKGLRRFLKYQLPAYPFSEPRPHAQLKRLLSLDDRSLPQARTVPIRQGASGPHRREYVVVGLGARGYPVVCRPQR